MTGRYALPGRTVGRSVVAAFAAIAVVALAPLASATPEGDADAAITAAWDDSGGEGGSLGVRDGGVYPVGAGFGQNFAGGKIYFTPDTGAHIMTGAILDKYLALGGPADSDLGFPDIDEGPGKAPDSRNTTFSAADNPVIFWTPDTGARVVRGAINAAWDQLGGSAAQLGVPTEDEVYRGDVVSQTFTGGQLSWDSSTKTFTTKPPELADQLKDLQIPGDATSEINAARRAAGGPLGPLGAAEGPPTAIGDDGLVQAFAGGKIFYSPATGAGVITGQVLAKYESVGGPTGDLGFPTGNESEAGLAPASRSAAFAAADQPVIFWTPDFGAVIVRGAMNAAWSKLGGVTGELGAPTADQTEDGEVVTQTFADGAISWDRSTGEFTTEPPSLASGLSGLQVPGQDAQSPPAAAESPRSDGQKWYRKFWWALAVVPVLVLVGAVVAAAVLNRRRADDRAPLSDFAGLDGDLDGGHDDDDYDDDDYDDDLASGPVPRIRSAPVGQPPYVPLSAWAMPAEDDVVDRGEDPQGDSAESDVPVESAADGGLPGDQDAIDTAPTRIPTNLAAAGDEQEHDLDDAADASSASEPSSGPPSGKHAALQLDEPEPAQPAFRLATEDPYQMPDGYPIKADTRTGRYWLPGSGQYDRVRAEVWFASEEFALTNGFVRA